MDNGAIDRIENQISHQSKKMEALTESISQLAQIMARKEERDHHVEESVKDIKSDVGKMKDKVSALEKISAGDEMMRKIFWVVLCLLIVTVAGAVFALVVQK